MKSPQPRQYLQEARAASAAATGERILDAFTRLVRDRWLDEVTLDDVAREAGVTVQTVIRRFGGKDGLHHASAERLGRQVQSNRDTPVGKISEGIAALVQDYETNGDVTVRLLAQEPRYPLLKQLLNVGRQWHRQWIESLLAPFLEGLEKAERERRVAAAIVVTDVYAWHLLRRDQSRSPGETRSIVEESLRAVMHIGEAKGEGG
jgi:AcrR family transcriptional regulator